MDSRSIKSSSPLPASVGESSDQSTEGAAATRPVHQENLLIQPAKPERTSPIRMLGNSLQKALNKLSPRRVEKNKQGDTQSTREEPPPASVAQKLFSDAPFNSNATGRQSPALARPSTLVQRSVSDWGEHLLYGRNAERRNSKASFDLSSDYASSITSGSSKASSTLSKSEKSRRLRKNQALMTDMDKALNHVMAGLGEADQSSVRAALTKYEPILGVEPKLIAVEIAELRDRLNKVVDFAAVLVEARMLARRETQDTKSPLEHLQNYVIREVELLQEAFLDESTAPRMKGCSQQQFDAKAQTIKHMNPTDPARSELDSLLELKQWVSQAWRELFVTKYGSLLNDPIIPDCWTKLGFHATSFRHLASVQDSGLDPGRGGRSGGGSVAIGGEHSLQQQSDSQSQGVIAVATRNKTLVPYIHMRGAFAELVPDHPVANDEVLMRFDMEAVGEMEWRPDPKHQEALQSRRGVPPQYLDVLTDAGWVPLQNLPRTELTSLIALTGAKPNEDRMAFDHDDFVAEFCEPATTALGRRNPRGRMVAALQEKQTIDKLRAFSNLKGTEVGGRSGGTFKFIGVTAHPAHNEKQWLYVLDLIKAPNAGKSGKLPDFYQRGIDDFNRKIYAHGKVEPIAGASETTETQGKKNRHRANSTSSHRSGESSAKSRKSGRTGK